MRLAVPFLIRPCGTADIKGNRRSEAAETDNVIQLVPK